jgi:hypothetical protein
MDALEHTIEYLEKSRVRPARGEGFVFSWDFCQVHTRTATQSDEDGLVQRAATDIISRYNYTCIHGREHLDQLRPGRGLIPGGGVVYLRTVHEAEDRRENTPFVP